MSEPSAEEQRAALLRVARRIVEQMKQEVSRLDMLGAVKAIGMVKAELNVLEYAVRGLWGDCMGIQEYTLTDRTNALEIAMERHRDALKDPVTELAAYGLAVATVAQVLSISTKAAALILLEEMEKHPP